MLRGPRPAEGAGPRQPGLASQASLTWQAVAKTATKRRGGRTTPKKGGRYTPPTPRTVKHSPRWLPVLIALILAVGILMIVLNYFDVLPGAPTNWYLLGGILVFALGFALATQWR